MGAKAPRKFGLARGLTCLNFSMEKGQGRLGDGEPSGSSREISALAALAREPVETFAGARPPHYSVLLSRHVTPVEKY